MPMTEQSHPTRESKCINCGKKIDRAGALDDGRRPQAGDFAVCIDCHHLQAYADDLSLRPLTEEEIVLAAGDPDVLETMQFLAYHRKVCEAEKITRKKPGWREPR